MWLFLSLFFFAPDKIIVPVISSEEFACQLMCVCSVVEIVYTEEAAHCMLTVFASHSVSQKIGLVNVEVTTVVLA